MRNAVVFFMAVFVLLFLSPVFAGSGSNKGAETFLLVEESPICLSFENYQVRDGWTPVVLSIGELDCLLWMDIAGRVSELRETGAHFVETVCFIDESTQSLRKGTSTLYFDVYEQNRVRTRWRLSPGGTPGTAGTVTKKILFREGGIELYLGNLRLKLNHVTWDFRELSPGLFQVKFHGPMVSGHRELVVEKAKGIIYSTHGWNNRLTTGQSRTMTTNPNRPASGSIPPQERAALIALYNITNGDYWDYNDGWKTPPLAGDGFALPGTENTWYGITCDPGNTTVQSINLESNNLNGTLPPELGTLANLVWLVLSSNQLSGSIPPELGNLANLQFLYLYSNQLSGTIPPELGNLANLQGLYISENQLSGSIPPELGNLAYMWGLNLGSNQLSGTIPPELGNLANLRGIGLFSNQLSGTIPPELGNLANLEGLYISDNHISGSIPPELGKLANLQSLFLYSNQLIGTIPPELGNLANLQFLYISSNQLSGTIPPELGNLANLRFINLSSNKLSGIIPSEMGNLANLRGIYLSSNNLSGNISSNLITLQKLFDNGSDLRWNALYTNDDILRAFLDSKQVGGNWESTQTTAPSDVTATCVSNSSIDINWTPIIYTSDTGGYRVFYSTTPGGPYTYFGMTSDKIASSLTFTGLNPGTTYYFVVQTRTYPHPDNLNTVDSEYSTEVSAILPYPLILTSPNGGEVWRVGTVHNITWTSSGLTGKIRLELWKADKKVSNIANNIPIVNCIYPWLIGQYSPGTLPTGNDYQVKMITANGLYNDTSDGYFSIVNPYN